MSSPASTYSVCTFWPTSPVCLVTRVEFSIRSALLRASSADFTRTTPRCCACSLNVPLPRPPAWICDFTTATAPSSLVNASAACSGVSATNPLLTGMPYLRKTSFAWNSWRFTGAFSLPRRRGLNAALHAGRRDLIFHHLAGLELDDFTLGNEHFLLRLGIAGD